MPWRARLAAARGPCDHVDERQYLGRTASVDAGRRRGDAFGDGIDVLIDAGATPGGLPSTIVDATGESPVLVRAGVDAVGRAC